MRHLTTALCLTTLIGVVQAHDIPADVAVQVFLKPKGRNLQILVRAPLAAMRDLDLPVSSEGYLDLARVAPLLPGAATLWIADFLALYEDGVRMPRPRVVATRISLPSDRSFSSFEEASRSMTGPRLPEQTRVIWNQTVLDAWFEYPIRSDRAEFAIDSGLARLGLKVTTSLRLVTPSGAVRAFKFTGNPGLVRLDPRWHQAALRFVWSGFLHILDGTDHLLFLLCLVIPFRRFRPLVVIVTAFTVAHSLTLILSAYGLGPDALWFPPLIETLIAASIVYMALENIAGAAAVNRRWIVAFGFGLIHGFGFSFALREAMQYAGSHLLVSLLAFNLGVELAQVLVLAVLILALDGLFRFVVAERVGAIIISALAAHTGWHWMLERGERLRQYRFAIPEFPPSFAVWAGFVLLPAVIAWLVVSRLADRMRQRRAVETPPAPPIAGQSKHFQRPSALVRSRCPRR